MPATNSHSVTNMSTETKKTTKKTAAPTNPTVAPTPVAETPKTSRKTPAKTEVTVPVVAAGLPAGSQRSQTDVTKFVSNYVKTHNCFDPANKRRIIPDSTLSRLLKVTDKDTVTYLNLQSYLKNHFLKA
ncbi:hypothetical protein EB118_19400 [bacterium]|nr:hypothetical protein [bacterium]